MKEKFLKCLRNHEYISNFLFMQIKKEAKELIPLNFDLDTYNNTILESLYLRYQDYFKNMYAGVDANIHLDKEQIKAVLADEDYSLILAGAGTGKTTTIAAKVKYLVDIKKVDPTKIIVMSYTRKATEELEKRIVTDFNIPAQVTTFHSLGMMYIREIFQGRKCYVIDENIREQIFYDYFKEKIFPYPNRIQEILENFSIIKKRRPFIFGNHFIKYHTLFPSFDDYFEYYKMTKRKEVIDLKKEVEMRITKAINSEFPRTIQDELVKSKGEAIIANFLYRNGIDYTYEKVYKELMPNHSTYRPDFTLDLAGEEVYIEYFGLSNNERYDKYERIRRQKEDYHKKHHNKLIVLDYMDEESLTSTLNEKLLQLGFQYQPKSDVEIFNTLLNHNKTAQIYPFKQFLYQMIDHIKSSPNRNQYQELVKNYLHTLKGTEQKEALCQFKYIHEFYCYYQEKLYGAEKYGFDFSDMIYYANLYIHEVGIHHRLHFDYLIIDEYQDISKERFEFTKNIAKQNHAKVIAVGDDWQSIFAFAGAKIQYIYHFEQYFQGAKLLKIRKAYRNSQNLIQYSSQFIMKNKHQLRKELITTKNLPTPIRFIFFKEGEEYETLKQLLLKIHTQHPEHEILLLARNNKNIEKCFKDPDLLDDRDTKIRYIKHEDIEIQGMTIHKAKGLTSDEVIVMGLNQNFPSSYPSTFWLETLFKQKTEYEEIPFAEERRLFYVALTRTKNHVYLLVNQNAKKRSPFINEIYQIIHNEDQIEIL